MDHRDVAGYFSSVLKNVDAQRMTATFTVEDDDGNEVEHTVRLKFEVCDTCNGRGSHVNPSIDAHGLSREDFDDDPDFEEDYFSGRYDVPCAECHGARVTPAIDPERNSKELVALIEDREAAEWEYARTCAKEREMGY
jgi:hypothetical protein